MLRLIDLYRVVGRRLTRKLLDAKWIVPVQNGRAGLSLMPVHRVLGTRLPREGYTLLPNATIPPTGIQERKAEREKSPSLEDIVLDEEALARLLE